ncbi:hypothetical protein BBC0244_017640 [Bartonella apihabitans]|nr:hypothetical protein BBC0244_017640 [Bartonella apihabitans]
MNGDNELFVTAIRNFAKSANVSENRFAWENIKPHLKSLKNHSWAEKVMGIARKLYCSNPYRFSMMLMVCCF